MMYITYLLGWAFLMAIVGVAINPLPHFATGALAVAAVFGAAVLVWCGGLFLPVVLLLIYLGGMLVVFAYAIALVPGERAEQYGGWGSWVWVFVLLFAGFCLVEWLFGGNVSNFGGGASMLRPQVDMCGVGGLYSFGVLWLLVCGVCLFICLFVVLWLSLGGERGAIRVF
uniref:NADH-ubiquinone oxidoreductase chain 6 n=1 Tax=Bipes tridactylus TaxID=273520 RepID=Q66SQ9_9SAUR|nr:NADH dehydrogenase subunit 6 [Bipes tridactylus]AAT08553.1 NADH dehydrogenase subunit 6 [Bipes tridactylus]